VWGFCHHGRPWYDEQIVAGAAMTKQLPPGQEGPVVGGGPPPEGGAGGGALEAP
jgi:hypothetical protein